jgi:hypothetical protein
MRRAAKRERPSFITEAGYGGGGTCRFSGLVAVMSRTLCLGGTWISAIVLACRGGGGSCCEGDGPRNGGGIVSSRPKSCTGIIAICPRSGQKCQGGVTVIVNVTGRGRAALEMGIKRRRADSDLQLDVIFCIATYPFARLRSPLGIPRALERARRFPRAGKARRREGAAPAGAAAGVPPRFGQPRPRARRGSACERTSRPRSRPLLPGVGYRKRTSSASRRLLLLLGGGMRRSC